MDNMVEVAWNSYIILSSSNKSYQSAEIVDMKRLYVHKSVTTNYDASPVCLATSRYE